MRELSAHTIFSLLAWPKTLRRLTVGKNEREKERPKTSLQSHSGNLLQLFSGRQGMSCVLCAVELWIASLILSHPSTPHNDWIVALDPSPSPVYLFDVRREEKDRNLPSFELLVFHLTREVVTLHTHTTSEEIEREFSVFERVKGKEQGKRGGRKL